MSQNKPSKPIIYSNAKSRDLVPTGPKFLSAKTSSVRNGKGEKPTTARALILRNGKYGARGTGEIVLAKKIPGREKLDLLADDLVDMSEKAVMAPFKLEKCLKIAESQFNAYLDDIASLQDSELFYSLIEAEYRARKLPDDVDRWKDGTYVAGLVSTRIHNTYTLASAWHIVRNSLRSLQNDGLLDDKVKSQLGKSEHLRSHYLVLYDIVNVLVNISQAKFSVLATTTSHYSRYFKHADDIDVDKDEHDVIFDKEYLRDAGRSFIDSIIIELCFPRSPYPRPVLYQILRDAVQESPGEARRFPQALWDAVGDLSVTVELQDMLEGPLIGPGGEQWKQSPREMPEQYEKWVDAQLFSERAANEFPNSKNVLWPLEETKKAPVLENMWKHVNRVYQEVSGQDIDTLWQLNGTHNRTPQWHSFYTAAQKPDSDDERKRRIHSSRKKSKRLAIKDHAGSDSDASMPSLQSVSNSSEDYDLVRSSDEEEESDRDLTDEGEDDSDYDSDQEAELRDMLRVAMDLAHETDLFNNVNAGPDSDPLAEDRKDNPFLKLLGSLRGRMFSTNPKLKTTDRTEPRPGGEKVKPGEKAQPSHDASVEDVEDEDDTSSLPKKKKKKKPRKKKKPSSLDPLQEADLSPTLDSPPASPSSPAAASSKGTKGFNHAPPPTPSNPSSTLNSKPIMHAVRFPPSQGFPFMSTTSLSLPVEQTAAQSARSYIQSEKLDEHKTKIKSRPDHVPSAPDKEKDKDKKGIFSKLRGKSKSEEMEFDAKHSWFSRLGKKTKGYMHQLLKTHEDDTKGIAPMKWDHFLKVMREMGFTYDPSTAGSSVRFDPPNPRDRSIVFHKPHPDPTLQPVMLKQFAKKLKRYYGWCEEDFLNPVRE